MTMTTRFLALVLAASLLLTACEKPETPYAQKLSARVIEPLYTSLSVNLAQLAQTSENFCTDNQLAADELAQIQQLWFQAATAWQKAQVIRFGPIEKDNRRWHFQFWPDRHNNTGKKMKRLLSGDAPITPESLETAGVVVQGFSALEYLLFDAYNPAERFTGANPGAQQRCRYLVHATEALSNTASSLQLHWLANGDYRQVFDHPGPDNPVISDNDTVLRLVIESIVTSLEIIKGDKLAKPLGLTTGHGIVNIYQAEAWRSQLSESFMQANLDGVGELLSASNAGILSQLDEQHLGLIRTLSSQLNDAHDKLRALDTSLVEALGTEEGQQKANDAMQAIEALLSTCKHDLPAAFQVTLGFNGNDGD